MIKLVEENKEKLKNQGNVQELYEKVKDAVQSGNTDSLKQYVQGTVEKAGQGRGGGGGGLEEYLKMLPKGGEITSKLEQLKEIAQEHGKEAGNIMEETIQEIQQVLQRKVGEAKELGQKAKENADKS